MNVLTLLRCTKCKIEKDSSEFSRAHSTNRKRKFQYYCKMCSTKSRKLYHELHPEKKREYDRSSYIKNRIAHKARSKEFIYRRKLETLRRYSINFDHPACVCCNESKIAFLTIDHINGGGTKHREEIAKTRTAGTTFYRWLKNHQYPFGYQTLCFNCNSGRSVNGGICPHKET